MIDVRGYCTWYVCTVPLALGTKGFSKVFGKITMNMLQYCTCTLLPDTVLTFAKRADQVSTRYSTYVAIVLVAWPARIYDKYMDI